MSTLLPSGYEALEPFVERWAIEGSANRLQARLDSEESERVAFFTAAVDLVPAALELLDQKPFAQYDDRENRLMNLVLSVAHVSLAVELHRDQEPKHAAMARYISLTRASADDNP